MKTKEAQEAGVRTTNLGLEKPCAELRRARRGPGHMAGMRVEYPIAYYHMITVAVKEKLEKFNSTWNERAVRVAKPLKRQLLGGEQGGARASFGLRKRI